MRTASLRFGRVGHVGHRPVRKRNASGPGGLQLNADDTFAYHSLALRSFLLDRFPEAENIHALSSLAHHAPSEAVEQLQRALPYDFALPGTAFFGKFGGLYPAYVRGQAYLQAHQGQEAAAEFQKILDRRGIVLADPIGALARLQLGRAYVLSGDRAKATAAYRDFLALWKHADPELPVLKEAKAEYARLR